MGALEWVGQIAEWVGQFVPRRKILDTTQGAVKYKRGATPIGYGAGCYWYWPYMSTWVDYPTARQTDRLESQTMVSADGVTFAVSGTLTYEVVDILALVSRTHSPVATVVESAGTALHDVLCAMKWDEIRSESMRRTIGTKLRHAAQKELDGLGVKVLRYKLNTLAPCRVLKVMQSTASEEN